MKKTLAVILCACAGFTLAAQDADVAGVMDLMEGEMSGAVNVAENSLPKHYDFTNFRHAEINKVPTLQVFWFPGMIQTGTKFKLNFYVSDFDQNEWRGDGKQREFKVTLTINGKQHTQTFLSGFCSIESDPLPEGRYPFSIQAVDAEGRRSNQLNFQTAAGDLESPADKVYQITEADLRKYQIDNHGDHGKLVLLNTGLPVVKKTARILLFDGEYLKMLEDAGKKAREMAESLPAPESGYIIYAPDNDQDGEIDFRQTKSFKGVTVKYAKNYDKEAVEKQAVATAEGLTKLFADLHQKGIKKAVLLPGTYRVSSARTVIVPEDFTLDLNGATIKMNPCPEKNAMILQTADGFNTHVTNGIIEGDYLEHDYENNDSEWVNGIAFGSKAVNHSFTKLTLRNVTGYGICTGMAKDCYAFGGVSGKPGDIDRETGKVIASTDRVVSDFLPVDKIHAAGLKQFKISRYLGYQGVSGVSGYYICHFYDEQQKYLSAEDAYQYHWINLPENAAFVRVVQMTPEAPDDLTLNAFFYPTNCTIQDVKVEFVRCVGICPCGYLNLLINRCDVRRSGENFARCGLDAEDGWNGQQNLFIRDTKFHDNFSTDLLVCAGHTGQLLNVEADNAALKCGGQFAENCRFGEVVFSNGSKIRNEANYIRNLTVGPWGMDVTGESPWKDYSMLVRDCTISCAVSGGKYRNCKIENCPAGEGKEADVADCKIKNVTMTLTDAKIEKCTVDQAKMTLNKSKVLGCPMTKAELTLNGSEFKDFTISDSTVTINGGTMTNMKFEKTKLVFGAGDTEFRNCTFGADCELSGLPKGAVLLDGCTLEKGFRIKNEKGSLFKKITILNSKTTMSASEVFTTVRDPRLDIKKARFPRKQDVK